MNLFTIDETTILLNLENPDYESLEKILLDIDNNLDIAQDQIGKSYYSPIYKCALRCSFDEEEHYDDVYVYGTTFGVKFNCCLGYLTGADDKTAFVFLSKLCEKTKGDFVFFTIYDEVIFERRKGIIYANKHKSYHEDDEYFAFTGISDCYDLVQLEHLNGYVEEHETPLKIIMDLDDMINEISSVLAETTGYQEIEIFKYNNPDNDFDNKDESNTIISCPLFFVCLHNRKDRKTQQSKVILRVRVFVTENLKDNRKILAEKFFERIKEKYT